MNEKQCGMDGTSMVYNLGVLAIITDCLGVKVLIKLQHSVHFPGKANTSNTFTVLSEHFADNSKLFTISKILKVLHSSTNLGQCWILGHLSKDQCNH